jgi:S1-C subfamily serine protease
LRIGEILVIHLTFGNPKNAALRHSSMTALYHLHGSEYRLGGQRRIVTVCRHLRIWVWLATFAILAVLLSGAAYSQDSYDPHLRSLSEYLADGTMEVSTLGITLREDRRELKSGPSVTGLLIVGVKKGSPAANAGLVALQETPKKVVAVIVVGGSMVFPPAMLLLPLAESLPIGRGGDLIIAADGSRVRNLLDFDNEIRDAQPGEIVYLTIVRAGMRKQVPVLIPAKEP